ncbi:Putative F-box/LRR-repeat protein At5g02930 [Linum perenne]
MAPTTTTTNKRIKSSTNNYEGRDRISDLPDEIIHKVLRRIASPAKAARTSALSRRWRSVWSSYPAVQYRHSDIPRSTVEKRVENFKKFVEASMERISRHSEMRMETLDIWLVGKSVNYSSLVKQLLISAMERKVEEISVMFRNPRTGFEEGIQANSGAKIIRLIGLESNLVDDEDYHSYFRPFLASLRILELTHISERIFRSMIARCPLLETLQIFIDLKELQISDIPNLKTLKIDTWSMNQEIGIEAPGLQNLHLRCISTVQKMELRAHELKHMEIKCLGFTVDLLNAVISELPSLKTLTLNGFIRVMKKLKLSIPRLEVFKLLDPPHILEEIELDAGPTLSRFFLQSYSPEHLQKCTINNASACRFEASFTMSQSYLGLVKINNLGSVKSFINRFPQFQTVSITNLDDKRNVNVTFNEEETGDNTSNPTRIDHLKYCTIQSNSKVNKRALLEALFKVCRPNYLTLIHRHKNSERFFWELLSLMQQKRAADKSLMWLNGLKDVKIITRYLDVEIEEEEEELIMRYQKCKTQNQLCFELTWDVSSQSIEVNSMNSVEESHWNGQSSGSNLEPNTAAYEGEEAIWISWKL